MRHQPFTASPSIHNNSYQDSTMKRLLNILLPIVALLGFTSCHDDNDLPDVDLSFNIEGAVRAEGSLYVVAGDDIVITGISVTNNDAGKVAMVTAASYYWDYYFLGENVVAPYGFTIQTTEDTPTGSHLLEVQCPVVAVDKAPATAVAAFNVVVVADASEIPAGGTTSFAITPRTTASK